MSSRVLRLRALIDHPATGANERAAARRMLDRILGAGVRAEAGDRVYGARYGRAGRHAGLEEVAELVRADIAFARVVFTEPGGADEVAVFDPIRDAPAGLVYEVCAEPAVSAIVVRVEAVPAEWGWGADGEVSPALSAVAAELAEIMNAYNRDGQGIGRRFFARVRVREQTLIW
ncbi:hypothetical protein ACWIGI_30965 [Nocardia sp. NPDC055321]